MGLGVRVLGFRALVVPLSLTQALSPKPLSPSRAPQPPGARRQVLRGLVCLLHGCLLSSHSPRGRVSRMVPLFGAALTLYWVSSSFPPIVPALIRLVWVSGTCVQSMPPSPALTRAFLPKCPGMLRREAGFPAGREAQAVSDLGHWAPLNP